MCDVLRFIWLAENVYMKTRNPCCKNCVCDSITCRECCIFAWNHEPVSLGTDWIVVQALIICSACKYI